MDAPEPDLLQFLRGVASFAETRQREERAALVERHRVETVSDVGWEIEIVSGIEVPARSAELPDDVPHTDEADGDARQLLGDLVGERDRQRRAAAEADDIDDVVAGFDVVLKPIHGLANAFVPADAER